MNLKERADLVDTVGTALTRGEHTLTVLPDLIKRLLQEDAWRDFETKMGKRVTYTRFEDFVVAKPLAGLGANIALIERIVKDDPETLLLLRKVLKRQGERTDLDSDFHDNIMEVHQPYGTSQSYALQRLEQDRPDLLEQVKAGNLTPHGAMVKAGFRRRVYSVNLDSPQSAHTLIEKASPAFLDELRKLLNS